MKKHKKIKYWYMHTVEGRPAQFYQSAVFGGHEGQVCYHDGPRDVVALVKTLRQIRREQQCSREFRAEREWKVMVYGYVKVAVPERDV